MQAVNIMTKYTHVSLYWICIASLVPRLFPTSSPGNEAKICMLLEYTHKQAEIAYRVTNMRKLQKQEANID